MLSGGASGSRGRGRRRSRQIIHRTVLAAGRGPVRRLWPPAYGALERTLAGDLLRGSDGSAYVRGGTGRDQPVYGISDIDLFMVVEGKPGERGVVRRRVIDRWRRLKRVIPLLARFVSVGVYEEEDLADAGRDSYLTHGFGAPVGAARHRRALYYAGREGSDDAWLRARPGLFGPLADWRLVRGRDRLPELPRQDARRRRIAAWCDVQHWWLHAFRHCADPRPASTTYLAAKLIVEPIRILLWLDGDRIWRRPDVLSEGRERFPEYAEALTLAAEFMAAATRPGGASDVDAHYESLSLALPHLVELSRAVSRRLEAGLDDGWTEVQITWGGAQELIVPAEERAGGGRWVPLCDWRSLCVTREPDKALRHVGSEPAIARVAECLDMRHGWVQPALGDAELLVLPAPEDYSQIRCVACRLNDPVSIALVEGVGVARFPEAWGFSARDWARRAIAERWAQAPEWEFGSERRRIGALFAAARAALFSDSIATGQPELPLTVTATAERLTEVRTSRRTAIEACMERYRALTNAGEDGSVGEVQAVSELIEVVHGLVSQRELQLATSQAGRA
jgi:hypothetical protein